MLCGRIDFRPLSFSFHFGARGNFFSVFSFLFLFPRNISSFFQSAYLLSSFFLRNFATNVAKLTNVDHKVHTYMKKIFIVLTIAFLGWHGIANGQQPATANMQPKTDSLYTLTAGHVAMTIDASFGGRIRSLRYDDREVLSQTRWPESFGSTFWTSPQSEWNWPPVAEIDKGAYTVEQADRNTITMTSQPSRRLGIAVTKRFTAADDGTSISVTYTISNVGSAERRVAPWEITRVPNGGLIFFDAPLSAVSPAGLLAFQSAHDAVWYRADTTGENRKINADASGWLAFADNGLLLVKEFPDLKATEPAPGEAEVQVYVNRGKTYIELESQGAYASLQPGEQLSWTVRWHLVPTDQEPSPSVSLLEQVRSLLKADE